MIKKVTGTCLKKLRQMVKIGHFGSSSEKGLFEWSNFFLVQKRMRRTVCIFFGICCLHPSSKNDHWIFEMFYLSFLSFRCKCELHGRHVPGHGLSPNVLLRWMQQFLPRSRDLCAWTA